MKERGKDRLKRAACESTLSTAGAVPLPQWGRLQNENAAFPILSFRAKARNLFRSRSGKGCEDSGELEAPCFQRIGRTVFHADSITKENGNGKRKRSLGCARQPLPREGAREDTPSFLWKEVPRRGGGWMGKAVSPTQSLPRVGNAVKLSKILIAHASNSVCFFHALSLPVNNKIKKLVK